ncbi:MAG: hypothetical protein KF819_00065 [Labilithrix sp.]|nr:hypothetical protein [Labilithrix sp.]
MIDVPEDMVLSLASRALARRRFPDLGFCDPVAEDVCDKLDLDLDRFDERRLRAVAVHTMVVDDLVRGFFARHPQGLAVALFPGLCTRFSRVDNGSLRWIDLEPPALAAFEHEILEPCDRHIIASCCSFGCTKWMSCLRDAADVPMLLIAEGGLMRAAPDVRDAFFTRASACLPAGTELVLDGDPSRMLRRASRASLAISDGEGGFTRFPRIRFVRPEEQPLGVRHDLAGIEAVSRMFPRWRLPAVFHLRLV